MEDQWRIATYDAAWRHMFLETGMRLREALGETAVRIDHVGSTSIVGMDAKPIIDIQISVSKYDSLLNGLTTSMKLKRPASYSEKKIWIKPSDIFAKYPEVGERMYI